MQKYVLEISWMSLWRVLFFIALAAIMFQSLTILMGLFLAIVISSGLEFIVNYLERHGIPRTLGVIIVFLFAAFLLIVTVYTVLPLLIIDINTAMTGFTKVAKNSWWGPFINIKSTQSLNQVINKISSQLFAGDSTPLGAVSDIFGSVALTLSVIVSSFYLSLTRDGVERFIRAVFTAEYEGPALRIYERARRRIGYWFRSQILLSVIIGLLVLVSLLTLRVDHAVLLAILAAIFELVPFIGPVLAGAAAVMIAFLTSPTLAFYTLIVFLVIHQLENQFLVPILMGRNVGLHPVIVIIALLIGLQIGGLLAVFISVPAAVVFQEILEGWPANEDKNHESGVGAV